MRQHSLALWWLLWNLSFFSILISCIPREMNYPIFTKLDSSADDAEISFRGGKNNKIKKTLGVCVYRIGFLYAHFNVRTVSTLQVSIWVFVYFPNYHIVLFPYGISLIWPIKFQPVLLSNFCCFGGGVWICVIKERAACIGLQRLRWRVGGWKSVSTLQNEHGD